jgi:hypothetical protein
VLASTGRVRLTAGFFATGFFAAALAFGAGLVVVVFLGVVFFDVVAMSLLLDNPVSTLALNRC